MASSHPPFESAMRSNGVDVVQFWADSEKSYTLEISDALLGSAWTTITNVPTRATPVLMDVVVPAAPGNRFLRLRTP